MKRFIIASVAVAGMLLVSANTSEAGGSIRFSFGGGHGGYYGGHGHHGHHGHHGYHGGYRAPVYNHYPIYRAPVWHDTSHYDYHPGGFQRHRNHYHYVPGHYHFHRQGHWDY